MFIGELCKKLKNYLNKTNLYFGFSGLILLLISLLGGLSLRETFSGDQALFVVFAQEIENGAILYRDVWDLKQPAIFIFYLVAGKLFGFSEFGVHLFELIYWLSLSAIMIVCLKNYFTNQFFALLPPLLTIGIYYSVSGSWHLTQAESLVCFPLFLCLWFCQKFLENPNKKSLLFLSGLNGGIVLLFKQMLIGIPFAFWLCVFYFLFFRKDSRQIVKNIGVILLGLLIPISIVTLYFAQNDSLSIWLYTTFIYPYQAAIFVTGGDRTQVLINGLIWFFKSYFPVISLTFVFLLLKIKKRREISANQFLFLGCLLWTFLGFIIILLQRHSWWEYHYSLLMLPLGILAVKGLEHLFEQLKNYRKPFWKIAVLAIIMFLFIPTARRFNHKLSQYFQIETVKIGQTELQVKGDNLENYRSISAETAFLLTENPKPKIFVMADPLYYYLSNSSPAISSNGWMPTLFTEVEWQKLNREMAEKKPKYVFLEKILIQLIEEKNLEFIRILNKNYSLHSTGEKVLLYRINE